MRIWRIFTVAAMFAASIAGATATASAATCTDLDVVSARGTFEPGTLGIIVGDPVYSALQNTVKNKTLTSYPVNYPADLGEPNSVQTGNRDLVNYVNAQAAACP